MSNECRTDDEATGLTSRLVGIESTDPGAFEGHIEDFVHTWLEERRKRAGSLAESIQIEELEALPGRRCLRALIPAEGTSDASAGPADLTLLCHMDTVRVGAGWSEDTPAFSPVLRDGELYGRGSCDMKGGLACALLAFSDALDEVGRRGSLPGRSMAIVCTVDEEDEMRGSEAAIRAGWLSATGWVLDTEPTDGRARGSHKGRTWYVIDMHGVTAHASTPWRGADAIAALAEAVCRIRGSVAALPSHPELGRSTVTFGQIKGGYSPYVVPDECHAMPAPRQKQPCLAPMRTCAAPGTGRPSSLTRRRRCLRRLRGQARRPGARRRRRTSSPATPTLPSWRVPAGTPRASRTGRAVSKLPTSPTSTFPLQTSRASARCSLGLPPIRCGASGPFSATDSGGGPHLRHPSSCDVHPRGSRKCYCASRV